MKMWQERLDAVTNDGDSTCQRLPRPLPAALTTLGGAPLRACRLLLVAALACCHGTLTHAADNAAACDRACLENIAGQYAAAMVKRDPAVVRVTSDFKASDNGEAVKLGAGESWQGITSFKSQPQFVADVPAQEIGYLGVVDHGGRPAFLALRLKIVNRAIAAAESILTHDGEGGPAFMPEGFIYREAPYLREVPKAVRSSREELLKVANTYWDVGATTHDGSKVPHAQDCWHFENGMNTNWERELMPHELQRLDRPEYQPQPSDGRIWTCAREVYLTTVGWAQVRDRHLFVDEERGLVFNIAYVDPKAREPVPPRDDTAEGGKPAAAPMQPPPVNSANPLEGPGKMPLGGTPAGIRAAMAGTPHTMAHFMVMRIVDGKIAREQEVMRRLPAGAKRTF